MHVDTQGHQIGADGKKKQDRKNGPLRSLKTLFKKESKKKQTQEEGSYPVVRTEGNEDNEEEVDGGGRNADRSKKPAATPSIEAVSAIQLATPTINIESGRERFISDNLHEFLSEDYLEVDMGQLKDEERQFMVVDKDTGRVYDLRNERHVERLTESEIVKSASTGPTSEAVEIAESKSVLVRQKPKKSTGGWSDWWQQKKANNEAFLLAAELGDL